MRIIPQSLWIAYNFTHVEFSNRCLLFVHTLSGACACDIKLWTSKKIQRSVWCLYKGLEDEYLCLLNTFFSIFINIEMYYHSGSVCLSECLHLNHFNVRIIKMLFLLDWRCEGHHERVVVLSGI